MNVSLLSVFKGWKSDNDGGLQTEDEKQLITLEYGTI